MKYQILSHLSSFFLFLYIVNNLALADEIETKEIKKVEIEQKATQSTPLGVTPGFQESIPESKASLAQENSLKKKSVNEVIINAEKPKSEADLIDGLILNRAMTRVGHRFYREFVSAYRNEGMSEHNGLTVLEQATARSGSKIFIKHNRKTIFITFVSPINRSLDEQAQMAAKRVSNLLLRNKQQAKWQALSEPDLAADEF